MKNKKININRSWIIDFIVFLMIIALAIVDGCFIRKNIKSYCKIFPETTALVCVLLPTVITVISISLSLNKEKIYGATFSEINLLRKSTYYNFLHISIIACLIFLTYTILTILNLRITLYFLSLISFFYSIYFLVQEIPLMIKSKRTVSKILKKYFKKAGFASELFVQKEELVFFKVIQNILLSEGIKTAFYILKDDNNEEKVLNYLLDLQNKYFFDMKENAPLEKISIGDLNNGINIIDSIGYGFQNIEQLFKCDDDFNYLYLFDKNGYYQITRSFVALHELCKRIGNVNKENKFLNSIIYEYLIHYFNNDHKHFGDSIIICMCLINIKDGETWFLEKIRDNTIFPGFIFQFDSCNIGFFLTMIMAHLSKYNILEDGRNKALMDFLFKPSKGYNSNEESWNENAKFVLMNTFNAKDVAYSLKDFIKFYRSVSEPEFYFSENNGARCCISYKEFSEKNVIDQWIEILLYTSTNNDNYNNLDLNNIIESLDEKSKKYLFELLSEKWLIKGEINKSIDSIFLKFLFDKEDFDFNLNAVNQKLIDIFFKFHERQCRKKINIISLREDDLNKIKNSFLESTNKAIKNNSYLDTNINLNNAKEQCFSFLFKNVKNEIFLKPFLDDIPYYFNRMLCQEIKQKSKKMTKFSDNMTEQNIKEIIDFKPKFTTEKFMMDLYCSEEKAYSNEIKKLDLEKAKSPLIPYLFFKSGAIRFNAETLADKTIVRYLNNDELEKFIEHNYNQFPNGLYRYSERNNDENHSFYVTKGELKEYLKKQIILVLVVYKICIEVDGDKCLLFEKNDDVVKNIIK